MLYERSVNEGLDMARILIIKDKHSNNETLLRCLNPQHELSEATGISAATHALRREKFDVVISNVHHIDGNVFEFASQIKCNSTLPDVPVIYFCSRRGRMANIASRALKAAFLEMGAAGYLALEDFCVGDRIIEDHMRKYLEQLISP